ncbi:ubiquitin carboxyl-terminal hydrolase 20-like [Anneissia japonica]|uniref:ubiquitin carboxyl-terminal hydrolase 20-like n=1 Tax=Anneissia japonica TaxID=1529436 RepID=UPI00142574AF|nr:ubiquitin carboxyl-terminal hydrolase 20-like [Anneissia japonica]
MTCPHTNSSAKFTKKQLDIFTKGKCSSCAAKGPNLWLCLQVGCGNLGCGESHDDHSSQHSTDTRHALALNLSTMRTWCNFCESEAYPVIRKSIDQNSTQYIHLHTSQSERLANKQQQQQSLFRVNSPVTQALNEFEEYEKPRGLTGFRNMGNTCYLNAAVQALSNCPPFTHFFLECGGYVKTEKKPYIAKSYQKLMEDVWGRRRPSHITPLSLVNGIKQVFPMFKGFLQQDTQEFLRCLMDRIHEELKEPILTHMAGEEKDDLNDFVEKPVTSERVRTRSCNSITLTEEEQLEPESEASMREQGVGSRSASQSPPTDRRKGNKPRRMRRKTMSRTESEQEQDNEATEMKDVVEEEGADGEAVKRKAGASEVKGGKKRPPVQYRSIVSDVFDGRVLSSVVCLTCDTKSKRIETFQDLSLPIPVGKEDLARIRASQQSLTSKGMVSCVDTTNTQSWANWMYSMVVGWIWGPKVTLEDCLSAFFSSDELKGDNMYSCDKCKKLRNGVKFSTLTKLPEVLCIHLKRFRHESMTSYSSKISNYVEFPLEGLDVRQFLDKDCSSETTTYDLNAVICHHGTAGGGHYTAYAMNWLDGQWYEFDDTYVTEVNEKQVSSAEAYVLFYKKSSDETVKMREKVQGLCYQQESLLHFYISSQWFNKFQTFAEPGPITNNDFLCKHGGVPPCKSAFVDELVTKVPQTVWDCLQNRYGGGPAVTHLRNCKTCQEELDNLKRRIAEERETFVKLHNKFQDEEDQNTTVYFISLSWFRQWETFLNSKHTDFPEPPGPIDNRAIAASKGHHTKGAESGQISKETWNYLHSIYGGGPEIIEQPNEMVTATDQDEEDDDEEDGDDGGDDNDGMDESSAGESEKILNDDTHDSKL